MRWYVFVNGEKLGPWSKSELLSQLKEGKITYNHFVMREGGVVKRRIIDVPEIFSKELGIEERVKNCQENLSYDKPIKTKVCQSFFSENIKTSIASVENVKHSIKENSLSYEVFEQKCEFSFSQEKNIASIPSNKNNNNEDNGVINITWDDSDRKDDIENESKNLEFNKQKSFEANNDSTKFESSFNDSFVIDFSKPALDDEIKENFITSKENKDFNKNNSHNNKNDDCLDNKKKIRKSFDYDMKNMHTNVLSLACDINSNDKNKLFNNENIQKIKNKKNYKVNREYRNSTKRKVGVFYFEIFFKRYFTNFLFLVSFFLLFFLVLFVVFKQKNRNNLTYNRNIEYNKSVEILNSKIDNYSSEMKIDANKNFVEESYKNNQKNQVKSENNRENLSLNNKNEDLQDSNTSVSKTSPEQSKSYIERVETKNAGVSNKEKSVQSQKSNVPQFKLPAGWPKTVTGNSLKTAKGMITLPWVKVSKIPEYCAPCWVEGITQDGVKLILTSPTQVVWKNHAGKSGKIYAVRGIALKYEQKALRVVVMEVVER